MYYKIEKEYAKKTKRNNLCIWMFVTMLIIILVNYFFINLNLFQFLFFFTLLFFLSLSLYFIRNMHSVFKSYKDVPNSVIELLVLYNKLINKNAIDILIDIITKEKLNSKEKIKFIIDYYSNKQPLDLKKSFASTIMEVFTVIISLMSIGYQTNINEFDTKKTTSIIIVGALIILLIYFFRIFIKFLNYLINKPDYDLYFELENNLRIIYLNYDEYFNTRKKETFCNKVCNFFKRLGT